jgi:hypothetical protein
VIWDRRLMLDKLTFGAHMRLWSLLARIPFTPQHREHEHILDRLLGRQQAQRAKVRHVPERRLVPRGGRPSEKTGWEEAVRSNSVVL